MPTIKLTQAAVEKLKPPTDKSVIYWDNQCPGFGLRITPRGRKTWLAAYRVDRKPVMETFGTLDRTPSVAEARERARTSMTKAQEGKHPVAERREEEKRATAEAAKQAAKAVTFGEVAERFLRDHIARNKRAPKYAREVRRILDHDVLPRWGQRPVREIGKPDVLDLLEDKATKRERKRKGTQGGAAVQANRTLTRLRTLFRWAVAENLAEADPTAGVRHRVKEEARDRALDEREICWFWAGSDKLGWPFGPLLKLLLLTAQRRDEVGGMRWAEIDLDKRIWTIPRERSKSDRANIVHLSAAAIEIIEAQPRTGELLFSATGTTPVSGYSRAKSRLDRLMAEQLHVSSGDPEAEIDPWIVHDLRRSAATGMAEIGIAPHVVDKILNHSAGTIRGVAAIYNRHAYLDERKAALEAWGRRLNAVVHPEAPTSNVVDLRATA